MATKMAPSPTTSSPQAARYRPGAARPSRSKVERRTGRDASGGTDAGAATSGGARAPAGVRRGGAPAGASGVAGASDEGAPGSSCVVAQPCVVGRVADPPAARGVASCGRRGGRLTCARAARRAGGRDRGGDRLRDRCGRRLGRGLAERTDGHRADRRQGLAPLEVTAAPGAQRPVQPDELGAVGADSLEARPAGRADDPVLVDLPAARGAVLDLLDLRDEGLFGQAALVRLAEALLGTDDPVDDDPEQEEDRGEADHERCGQVREGPGSPCGPACRGRPSRPTRARSRRCRRRSPGCPPGRAGC